jgi:hypothetical protein
MRPSQNLKRRRKPVVEEAEEAEEEAVATGEWEGQGEGDVAEVEEEFELAALVDSHQAILSVV